MKKERKCVSDDALAHLEHEDPRSPGRVRLTRGKIDSGLDLSCRDKRLKYFTTILISNEDNEVNED